MAQTWAHLIFNLLSIVNIVYSMGSQILEKDRFFFSNPFSIAQKLVIMNWLRGESLISFSHSGSVLHIWRQPVKCQTLKLTNCLIVWISWQLKTLFAGQCSDVWKNMGMRMRQKGLYNCLWLLSLKCRMVLPCMKQVSNTRFRVCCPAVPYMW